MNLSENGKLAEKSLPLPLRSSVHGRVARTRKFGEHLHEQLRDCLVLLCVRGLQGQGCSLEDQGQFIGVADSDVLAKKVEAEESTEDLQQGIMGLARP